MKLDLPFKIGQKVYFVGTCNHVNTAFGCPFSNQCEGLCDYEDENVLRVFKVHVEQYRYGVDTFNKILIQLSGIHGEVHEDQIGEMLFDTYEKAKNKVLLQGL